MILKYRFMKKILLLVLICLPTVVFSNTESVKYDSLRNYVGDHPEQYTGQTVVVKGLLESDQAAGYSGFIFDYKKDRELNEDSNIYYPNGSYASHYEALVGHRFDVVDVISHPLADGSGNDYDKIAYLKLRDRQDGTVLFYKYYNGSELNFPFLVMGYYEKLKGLLKDQRYVFAEGVLSGQADIESNEPIEQVRGEEWLCTDVVLDDDSQIMAILSRKNGQQVSLSSDVLKMNDGRRKRVYTAKEYKDYEFKYGKMLFGTILRNSVGNGMDKDMCELSWGKPLEVIEKDGGIEEWVYPAVTVRFKRGIIVDM